MQTHKIQRMLTVFVVFVTVFSILFHTGHDFH